MLEEAPGLEMFERELDWPPPRDVLRPAQGSARMFAQLAEEKIGVALKRICGADGVQVGVLSGDASTPETEAPLAIVCEFRHRAPAEVQAEAHRLAWNFCRAPVLVTIDPHAVDVWSCFVPPGQVFGRPDPTPARIQSASAPRGTDGSLGDRVVESLRWLSFVSGKLIEDNASLFPQEGRADQTLLENLKAARADLLQGEDRLPPDLAHDLLARLMFIQFLFDRQDASGESALNEAKLAELHRTRQLAGLHRDLQSVLSDYDDAYALFRWLNDRFNGDLFPAKSDDPSIRELQWREEMDQVGPRHLLVLADLISGRLAMRSQQLALWRMYAFDTIPLEFVSSIYEEFVSPPAPAKQEAGRRRNVRPRGLHYTPVHLVDFVLDGILSWDDPEWDLRILDPSCGSGTFLVRCFLRLVHRWRMAHPGETSVPPNVLLRLLERNLCGIDVNPHAVRVASFSLYLAMCDHIDPRRYWTDTHFPALRERTLATRDFFLNPVRSADGDPFAEPFDLVVGNAPWGEKTMTEPARVWAKSGWPTPNDDIGVLFLGRSLELLKPGGRIAMVQSAGALLINAGSAEARRALFDSCRVEEIVNLSCLRFKLFSEATSPSCVVTLRKAEPDGSPTIYACPKLLGTPEDEFRIVIEDPDVHTVQPWEIEDPWTWTVLMGGGRRDLELVRRMRERRDTFASLIRHGEIEMQEGIIPGENRPVHPGLRDRPVLYEDDFPRGTFLTLQSETLPMRSEIRSHRKTKATVFDSPQLLIKQTLRKGADRFRAVMTIGEGVVCTQSYLTVHALTDLGGKALLGATLTINSRMAAYYLSLTTGRISYRPELRVGDLRDLPLADPGDVVLSEFRTFAEIDAAVERAFDLSEPERILLDDGLNYVVPELLRKRVSPGREETSRGRIGEDVDRMADYCRTMLKVLGGAQGRGRYAATVFEEADGRRLPLRVVAIRFEASDPGNVAMELIDADRLSATLYPNAGDVRKPRLRKVVRVFDLVEREDGTRAPIVYFVRPDQQRFWTRSAALRDADRLVAEGIAAAKATVLSPPSSSGSHEIA
ncbi:HsdM family class I SAM-dependent methyltransferase [Methylorubrum rhodesianum]|uniref:HsdM family class I SAM-dependent methyltransferase n=1 Tax=Methylorubrum rhodesianum TaxID=29427 RepID=UPI003D068257